MRRGDFSIKWFSVNKKVSTLSRAWLFVVLWLVTSIVNANLQAENEIQVKGSNIAVAGGLQLDARDDVHGCTNAVGAGCTGTALNLLAGENSSTSSSESSSHSESASYSSNGGPSGSLSANKTESTSESNYYTNN